MRDFGIDRLRNYGFDTSGYGSGYGYDKPLSQAAGVAPAYSFGKVRSRRVQSSKIHAADVKEIRRWVVNEGFGMPARAQARAMRRRYPGLSESALFDIVRNTSWYDPNYDRETPGPEWNQVHPVLLLLLMIRQMYSSV